MSAKSHANIEFSSTLVAEHSNKCAAVSNGSVNSGTSIIQYQCGDGSYDKSLTFEPAGDGTYLIRPSHSRSCYDISGASTAAGAAVQQYTCHEANNQRWYLRRLHTGNDHYQLVNKHSGKCLDVPSASQANGVALQQHNCHTSSELNYLRNQIWKINNPNDFYSRLTSNHNGLCMAVSGASTANGAGIVQWSCGDEWDKVYRFEPTSNNAFYIKAAHSGKCLDVPGFSQSDGVSLQQHECNGGQNQKWRLQKLYTGTDHYQVVNVHSKKCLDFANPSLGASFQQYSCMQEPALSSNGTQIFRIGAPQHAQRPYVARKNFNAINEPVGKVLHGAGQDYQSYIDYTSLFPANNQPHFSMSYVNLSGSFGDIDGWFFNRVGHANAHQIGIEFVGKANEMANGVYDANIEYFLDRLAQLGTPAFIRIGYEFEGPWNQYTPAQYVGAFQRITGKLRARNIPNVATVWCAAGGSAGHQSMSTIMSYYPGDFFVDWWGVDMFAADQFTNPWLEKFLSHRR